MTIKRRLLTAFFITSLLPVLIVALYSNARYEASITEKISAYSTQILDEVNRNATRELEQYETLTESIIMNPSIQGGLPKFHTLTDIEKNELQTRIGDELSEHIFRISNLTNVIVLTNDGKPYFELGYELYPDDPMSEMLARTDASFNNAYWSLVRSNRGRDNLVLSRKIYAVDDLNRQIGYVAIFIDEKTFARNIFANVNLGPGSSMYIADADGVVMSSIAAGIRPGSTYGEQAVFAPVRERHASGLKGEAFSTTVGGEHTLAASSYIRFADWHLIGLIPHAYILGELAAMRGHIVLLCLATLLATGTVSMWIYYSISHPMRALLLYAQRIKKGELDTVIESSYSDEMDKLTGAINGMVVWLRELLLRVEKEQQAKREAELKMLYAQINPHFLFNTLNSLKWSAMLGGNKMVSDGLESLSELLRNTILVKEELIPLEKELENVLHYANIQRIRYGDSFTLHTDVDLELLPCPVPKFILQPIVENSIIHGIEETDGRSVRISITAAMEHPPGAGEPLLKIRIEDNGKGFDTTEPSRKRQGHSKLSGIGIDNVQERIALHFGEPHGLVTRSAVGEGTVTEITLPTERKRGERHV